MKIWRSGHAFASLAERLVHRLGVRDEWFAFKQQSYAAEIGSFLKVNGIPFKDDVVAGG